MKLKGALFWSGLLSIFITFGHFIWTKEQLKINGDTLYLPLKSASGDRLHYGQVYRLAYDKTTTPSDALLQVMPVSGQVIFKRNEHNIGSYQRLHQDGLLADDELRVDYHIKGQDYGLPEISYGPEFLKSYAQDREAIEKARYAVLKVGTDGQSLVIGLADENVQFIPLKALN